MQIELVARVDELPAVEWNALGDGRDPFTRHEFLATLERTGCVGGETGWTPCFVTLRDARGLAAGAPGWLKTHSYGEFVFDFAWAQAYARHRLAYYPKLVIAVPFTPATGPRLLVRQDLPRGEVAARLLGAIESVVAEQSLSSAHLLFPDEADRAVLTGHEAWLMRRDCQFHWTNRSYSTFDDFLSSFTAEKRKKARRERRRVAEAGIRFEARFGRELSREELLTAWTLHRITFLRRGNEPYLGAQTFVELAAALGDRMLFVLARLGDDIVAVAVFFVGHDTLYGRYWGAAEQFHSLHFETCYHQGIEFCIAHGLARFEPGTQGEHKVSRGFEPCLTHSAHFIGEPRFRTAIADYLQREGVAIDEYAAGIREHVPYREEISP